MYLHKWEFESRPKCLHRCNKLLKYFDEHPYLILKIQLLSSNGIYAEHMTFIILSKIANVLHTH